MHRPPSTAAGAPPIGSQLASNVVCFERTIHQQRIVDRLAVVVSTASDLHEAVRSIQGDGSHIGGGDFELDTLTCVSACVIDDCK